MHLVYQWPGSYVQMNSSSPVQVSFFQKYSGCSCILSFALLPSCQLGTQVLFFLLSFQQPRFCCLDIFRFLPGITGTQMDHNIGFFSAFTRNQSRLCDLCRWWANHHVVFCQIPDSSCLFAWWYSNTPFLVCIIKTSFMHHRGEGIRQKGLLWSQKHSTARNNDGKGYGSEGKEHRCSSGITVLTLGVTKR